MKSGPSQVTILPAQSRHLAYATTLTNCAIGVTQDGSTLHLDTGKERYSIDAEGNPVEKNPNQETLC